jgi:hypothetical protein
MFQEDVYMHLSRSACNLSSGISDVWGLLLTEVSYLNSIIFGGSTYIPVLHAFKQWRIAVVTRQMKTLLIESKKVSSKLPLILIPAKYLR